MHTARRDYRILIVEDHTLFAESLEMALGTEGYRIRRFPVPESGTSLPSLATKLLQTRPHLVLLDLDLGAVGDSSGLIGPLARAGVNVVVVTASRDRARWGECVRMGARKVISKTRPLKETMSTVRRLHQGLQVMTADEREELLDHFLQHRSKHQGARERLALLTERERHVLGSLMGGNSVREIAAASVVSEATVRTQVKSILAKLEVNSQLAAVGLAHDLDWRPPLSS